MVIIMFGIIIIIIIISIISMVIIIIVSLQRVRELLSVHNIGQRLFAK